MTINIITVGKLKERYWREACDEYCKRLSAYGKINIYELSESRLPDSPSDKEITAALSNEAKLIRPHMTAKGTVNIALCIEGEELPSEMLAKRIEGFSVDGYSTLNFIIGSSFGLDADLKKECRFRLSMSPMTFPHQLARVMLLEQIYRAFSIIGGTKYHK